jgi:hypothetical protein
VKKEEKAKLAEPARKEEKAKIAEPTKKEDKDKDKALTYVNFCNAHAPTY